MMTANPISDSSLPFTAEDNTHFSLDDDDQREGLLGGTSSSTSTASTATMTHYRANQMNPPQQRAVPWRDKANGEASRLTDEIELDDADSGSDDLDLLPPLTSNNSNTNTTTKSAKKKIAKAFACCSPYFVPPRCSIM